MAELIDIGELRTRFTGDLSDLQAKSRQAQEINAQTAKAMTTSLNQANVGAVSLGQGFTVLSRNATLLGAGLTVGLTAPLALMGRQAITAGSSFETSFAGVRKTVQATESELAIMREGFRNMAKEIPVTANEMGRIGEAAGALGVKKEDILSFTRTMADLGVATNLTSDQAATGLARLANIIKNEAGPQYDRLGATLVALGNAGASTESEILAMSLRIAGAGKQAGLSESDILGFANALSSVGIEAEAGGSSMSRLLVKITDATKLGGRELKIFAEVAGQSASAFKKAFEQDGAGATISFIEGLGKIAKEGRSITPILEQLELADIRVSDALRRAAGSGDLFRESIALGSKAWAENTALTKEAEERYKTFDSQFQVFKNRLTDVGIQLFDQFRPALLSIINSFKDLADWLGRLDPTTRQVVVVIGLLAASIGPALLAIGGLSRAIVSVSEVMTVLNVTSIPRLIGGFGLLGGAAGLAAAAVTGAFIAASIQWSQAQQRFETGMQRMRETAQATSRVAMAEAVKQADVLNKSSLGIKKGDKIALTVSLTAETKRAEEEVKSSMDRIKTTTGAGGSSAGKAFSEKVLTEVQKLAVELSAAARGIVDGMNQKFREVEIGKILQEKTAPAVDRLKESASRLREQSIALGSALNSELGPSLTSISAKVIHGDGSFEALINRMIDMKRASGVAAEAAKRVDDEFRSLSEHFQDLSRTLPNAWNTIIDSILQGSGRLGTDLLNLGVKVKGYANDIINVFDTLPGKWGDSLRKALDEVNKWINFIDSALKFLNRIFSSVPAGLGDLVNKVVGVFKGVSTAVSATMNTAGTAASAATAAMAASTTASTAAATAGWVSLGAGAASASATIAGAAHKAGDAVDAMNKKTQGSVSKLSSGLIGNLGMIAGAIGGIAMVLGVQGMGRVQGTLQGALGGLTAGASIGFMFGGPVGAGIGALIGGIGGALAGFFGSGKTAAQKSAEAQQLQQVRLNAQQTGQQIINTYMDGIAKALDLAPRIAEFEGVSKSQIQKVFKFMERVVNHFLDSAKRWNTENLKKGQEVAEAIGPVFEVMSVIPQVENAFRGSFGVSDAQIDLAFSTLDKIVDRWSARAEQWIGAKSKQIQKVAERLAPAVNLISPLIQAITDTSNLTEPSDAQLGIVDRTLDKIITMVGGLAEKFAKPFLKALENLAEKVGPALGLWKDQVELIKATIDVPALKESDADNVVGGMRLFLEKLIAGFATFKTEGLDQVLIVIQAITPIAGALKVWAETAILVREYTQIGAETWDAIIKDFQRGIFVMNMLIVDAQLAVEKALIFQGYIDQFSNIVGTSLSKYASTIASAASTLLGMAPTISIHENEAGAATLNAPLSRGFAPSSFAPLSSGGSQTIINNYVTVEGSLIRESELDDRIFQGNINNQRRGR